MNALDVLGKVVGALLWPVVPPPTGQRRATRSKTRAAAPPADTATVVLPRVVDAPTRPPVAEAEPCQSQQLGVVLTVGEARWQEATP
ncbi:hypothetical protein [Streptomyces litchfieldiae]|uniref:Secreted protein n=1 Tax=Streptomyces litchfieldiae TaxID=3075543 RepID=A0ABU2N0Z9_9ACTN|nr:hypothetical protein [Streptomyces sp. DSM 44938]MDT0346748.1 hypothetical protein [Streptomyces sp. DSM 44938]